MYLFHATSPRGSHVTTGGGDTCSSIAQDRHHVADVHFEANEIKSNQSTNKLEEKFTRLQKLRAPFIILRS